jgi:ribonuclease HI
MQEQLYLSDSQVATAAFDNFQIYSKLVWACHQPLTKLAQNNRIQLVCVPGDMGIDKNKTADQLARQGSSHPLAGAEPTFGIPTKVAMGVIRD